jgi:hypothetical protein
VSSMYVWILFRDTLPSFIENQSFCPKSQESERVELINNYVNWKLIYNASLLLSDNVANVFLYPNRVVKVSFTFNSTVLSILLHK